GIFASTYWTLRLWIWSTSAFFSCRFSSAWRAFMIRFTLSYDGFICRFSIFTIVDWLTFARRAIAVCVSPSAFRSRGISSRSGIIGLREGQESTYSCRNFRLNQILSEGPFSGGLETTCLGAVPSAERARATKAIYGTGHPRR